MKKRPTNPNPVGLRAPNRSGPRLSSPRAASAPVPVAYEADTLDGLEAWSVRELEERLGGSVQIGRDAQNGRVAFRFAGNPHRLLACRSLLGVYRVLRFDVPRPKALLGHEHFSRLVAVVGEARRLHPSGAFRTLRLGAAGAESSVLQRLARELETATGLLPEQDDQDLLVRLRRDDAHTGWEALISLSPRPLSSRPWRVCNLPGAMNAVLAYAMARHTIAALPGADGTVLNLCCGSGTLLIERAALGPATALIGCDISPTALECARVNVEAAGFGEQTILHPWNAAQLPLPDQSVDVVLSDLPFGQRVGSHRENELLYPCLITEATRVARPGAVLCLLTHEVRLLADVLRQQRAAWTVTDEWMVRAGGMNPRVFCAVRNAPA